MNIEKMWGCEDVELWLPVTNKLPSPDGEGLGVGRSRRLGYGGWAIVVQPHCPTALSHPAPSGHPSPPGRGVRANFIIAYSSTSALAH